MGKIKVIPSLFSLSWSQLCQVFLCQNQMGGQNFKLIVSIYSTNFLKKIFNQMMLFSSLQWTKQWSPSSHRTYILKMNIQHFKSKVSIKFILLIQPLKIKITSWLGEWSIMAITWNVRYWFVSFLLLLGLPDIKKENLKT